MKIRSYLFATLLFCMACNDDDFIPAPTGETCEAGPALPVLIQADRTLSADTIYRLSGPTVVAPGATLTLEPGVIVKAEAGAWLLVPQGARILAQGTADAPIVFTSVQDNVSCGEISGGNLGVGDVGLWGGLIVLGEAPVSKEDPGSSPIVDLLPPTLLDSYGEYGGVDPEDDSGVLSYVSLRHGGAGSPTTGGIPLLLGGVGNGTVVDHVEVVASQEDGFRVFGGTVALNRLLVVHPGDDGLDIDQGYAGVINESLILMGKNEFDEALEWDGPEGEGDDPGAFLLYLQQCSFINKGPEQGRAALLKRAPAGYVQNCSWEGFEEWMAIGVNYDPDSGCAPLPDAYDHILASPPLLQITGNDFVSSTALPEAIFQLFNVASSSCPIDDPETKESLMEGVLLNSGNQVTETSANGVDASAFLGWSWADVAGEL